MRKQYHFRQVGDDTYIWDVHRLLELSQNFQVKDALLSEIKELNEAYWFPDTHPTTQQIIEHIQLIQDSDLKYPIILSADGRVMAGMHRVAKPKLLNHSTLQPLPVCPTPTPDFPNVDADTLQYDD